MKTLDELVPGRTDYEKWVECAEADVQVGDSVLIITQLDGTERVWRKRCDA